MNIDVFKTYTYEQQKERLEKYLQPVDPLGTRHTCGDGRKCVGTLKHGADITDDTLATQNFGGSLGAAASLQIYSYLQHKPMSYEQAIETTIDEFKKLSLDVGDHRDVNKHPMTDSGCGYADNRAAIIAHAATNQNLAEELNKLFGEDIVNSDTQSLFNAVVDAYKQLHADINDQPHLIPDGELLIDYLEAHDGTTQLLEGVHVEYAMIVNRRISTTLNTNSLVNDKGSAFNVDEYFVLYQQDQALKIPNQVAKMINYVDWASTLAVLTKGKPELPVFIYE